MSTGRWFATLGSTTMRRRIVGLLPLVVLLGSPARGAEPVGELELVRAALESPTGRARAAAAAAAIDAAEAPRRRPSNPVLDLRHEQANGPAGASTDVVGAAWTLGLGLPAMADQRASRQRGDAARSAALAGRVGSVCAVREAILDAWRSGAQASNGERAHSRLVAVARSHADLAGVGDLSQYEQGRAALAVTAHRSTRDRAASEARAAAAEVEAWTGLPADAVVLLPLTPPAAREEFVARAVRTSPRLVALRAQRAAVASELAAARRAALPSLTVAGGGRWDALPDGTSRTPGFEVGAALELPVFDRNQTEQAELAARLSSLDAALARQTAAVEARVRATWATAAASPEPASGVDEDALWQGALERTSAGEGTLADLLGLAHDLEAAAAARIDAEARRRAAHLSLACTTGAFSDPGLQALLAPASAEVSR